MFVLLKKTGGEPREALDEYIKRWSTQLPGSFSRDILPEPSDAIKLCHLVALHSIPENHLADNYIETLESRFRRDPKADLQKKTFLLLGKRLEGFKIEELEASVQLIRLFAFRYLRPSYRVDDNTVKSRLLEIMERSAGDTMDLRLVSTLLEDVYVHHIVKIQELIGAKVKVRIVHYRMYRLKESSHF